MNLDQINRWLTLVANLGVIAGIVLVAAQLRQNALVTSANLSASAYQQETDYFVAMLGENPSAVVAKATIKPGELTADDVIVLENEVNWFLSMFRRNAYLERKGVFDGSWRRDVLPFVGAYLGSDPVRRAYLASVASNSDGNSDWMKDLQAHAASVVPGEDAEYIESLLRAAKQVAMRQ